MRRFLGIVLLSSILISPGVARACPYDETAISFKRMSRTASTGDDYFHRMIIGRVVDIRDTGDPGGEAIAVVAVGAHPTGFVPLVARVRIEEASSILDPEPRFQIGERWVIVARHRNDGFYQHTRVLWSVEQDQFLPVPTAHGARQAVRIAQL